jgi:hypothetical protein
MTGMKRVFIRDHGRNFVTIAASGHEITRIESVICRAARRGPQVEFASRRSLGLKKCRAMSWRFASIAPKTA